MGGRQAVPLRGAKSQRGAKDKSLLFFVNFARFATLRETVFLIVAAQCVRHFRQRKSLDVIMHINKTLLLGRSARGGWRKKKGSHKTFSLAKSSYKVR
jgi:hypothetical protein